MQSANFSSSDEEAYCRHVKERAQKITEAMYRVSELFPEKEPLRWQLRQIALQIFNDFSTFKEADLYQRVEAIRNAPAHISRICALIDLASAGSLVSHFNFDVLRREYTALLSFILEHKSLLEAVKLPKLSLPVFSKTQDNSNAANARDDREETTFRGHKIDGEKNDLHAAPPTPNNRIGHSYNDGHSIGHLSPIGDVRYNANPFIQPASMRQQNEQKKNPELQAEKNENHEEGERFSAGRKQQIIHFMRAHGWVSVGDLASVFNGQISEKTLQRDLISMVERGLLRKEGDKRWRRYMINKAGGQHTNGLT